MYNEGELLSVYNEGYATAFAFKFKEQNAVFSTQLHRVTLYK